MRILGITNKEPSGLHLCWSASGIAFVTAASVVTVEMAAQSIAAQEDAFMGVFINDEKQFRQKIRAVPGKRKYIIYQQESAETVRIRLVKLTEEQYGKVWITNLITDAPVTRDAIPSRHLLFIGDSLTAGYGVDGLLYIVGMGYYPAGLPRSRIHLIRKTFFPKFFPIYKTKFQI